MLVPAPSTAYALPNSSLSAKGTFQGFDQVWQVLTNAKPKEIPTRLERWRRAQFAFLLGQTRAKETALLGTHGVLCFIWLQHVRKSTNCSQDALATMALANLLKCLVEMDTIWRIQPAFQVVPQ